MLRWKIAQWFEVKWWKNYLTRKSKSEYVAWKQNYWLRLVEKAQCNSIISKATKMVDYGCGPFGLALANNVWKKQLTSIDPLLDEYESKIPFFVRSDYPGTQFITSSIEAYTSADKYDVVFSMNALNHVLDIEKAYDIVCGSCNQGGYVMVSIDAHNHKFFKYLFRIIPFDVLHPWQFDLSEYKAFMEKRGCKVISETLMKHEFFFDHIVLVAIKNHH